jgi:hypothetical protein
MTNNDRKLTDEERRAIAEDAAKVALHAALIIGQRPSSLPPAKRATWWQCTLGIVFFMIPWGIGLVRGIELLLEALS